MWYEWQFNLIKSPKQGESETPPQKQPKIRYGWGFISLEKQKKGAAWYLLHVKL